MRIAAPTHPVGDMNRSLECEGHLDAPIRQLVDEAVTAGWTAPEIFMAIEEVVKAQRSVYSADPDPVDTPVETDPANDWPASAP
ncbi:hypothetical protein [Pararhizobium gei]|uniref:hypothetical protein n=1 Tax=Pararhizobium gei TaxID=1395951 RepID=UPI0023DC7B0E|nr:hypothetical protein [Rhizobium gei]